MRQILLTCKESVENELNNLIAFWLEHGIDWSHNTLNVSISMSLKKDKKADMGVVLCSRMLWTFSRAALKEENNTKLINAAHIAYQCLMNYFWDEANGGFYFITDYKGNVKNTNKYIYAQAFCIYALSEYYKLTADKEALNKAVELFEKIEEKSYDGINGGYTETLSINWSAVGDTRLSEYDQNAKKSMNTHLHLMEAYTNLYIIYPNTKLKNQIEGLINVFLNHIISKKDNHFNLFFDEQFIVQSSTISYGHEIESCWLLNEAAQTIKSEDLLEKLLVREKLIASNLISEAIDNEGAMINEKAEDAIDENRIWWVQAEACVGFLDLYIYHKNFEYFEKFYNCWNFIIQHMVDKKYGEWYNMVDKDNKVVVGSKVDLWKGPYHNIRSCYEILFRLNKLLS